MTIRLVTDSTCDLPAGWVDAFQLTIVPINIQFGTASYQENLTLTADAFYDKISAENILPKTSQPAVGQFVETYQALSRETDEIISIHVTSKLSGTVQAAVQAATLVADRVKVTVIDSLAGSAGLGWLVHEAAMLVAQRESATVIKQTLEARRVQISLYFAVDTLEYAQMSGRVGKLGTVLGTLLKIKPIIGLEAGHINVCGRVRSRKAAEAEIIVLTQAQVTNRPVNVAVVHAQASERAARLMQQAKAALNAQKTYIQDVAISLAVHFGPGTLGLITYPGSLSGKER